MSERIVQRQVDFLGIPIKRGYCEEGYYEELTREPLIANEKKLEE